ncbi:MAG TPA: glycosyltransferase [Streptosporangiaceae bacterium]|jgi:1,2-diacylglycerol 3-beta-galactosyltransferase
MPATAVRSQPVPLLFLLADTGGGHRSAALAVREAIEQAHPGQFSVTFCDPLAGPGVPWPLRLLTSLYGPAVRLATPAWAAAYYLTNSRPAVWLLERTVLALAVRPLASILTRLRPALIVSFHPLASPPVGRARRALAGLPLLTVVTDLAGWHASWRGGRPARIIAPAAGTAGLPVGGQFQARPASQRERARLRRSLGLRPGSFTVLLAGGGEGYGALARQAAAILRLPGDLQVAVICGRNLALRRRLARLAGRENRLTVLPFVDNMAAWLRSADVCVTKAGPATIAEAACCGTPLLLTSHLPGQERGNIELVAGAGAGRLAASRPAALAAQISRLRGDPAALTAMRAAAARLGSPAAAGQVADAIAALALPAGTRGGAVLRGSNAAG